MVITPLVQMGIDIKLPEVQAESKGGQDPNIIVLTVKKNDQVEIQRNPLELRMLLEELRRLYAARQDKTIFIRADAKIPFSKVMEVLDICKGAGVETLAIIPEKFEE
jgi:biopolymer transport protein ExbD